MFSWKEPTYNLIRTKGELEDLASKIEETIVANKPVCVDVETTGLFNELNLNPYYGWLLGISVCFNTDEGYYIPITHTKNGKLCSKQLKLKQIIDVLNPIVSTKGVYLGHNIKFDYKFLWKAGLHLNPVFWDTGIAVQLLNGNSRKTWALKSLVPKIVDMPQELIKSFSEVSEEISSETPMHSMCEYAINDTIFTYYLYKTVKNSIDSLYYDLFYNVECPLVPILAQMELLGINIDVEYFRKLKRPLQNYREKIKTFFENNYGINVASPTQVGEYFAKKFPNLSLATTPGGDVSTDEESLNKIIDIYGRHTPIAKTARRILAYRKTEKYIGTYIEKFSDIGEHYYGSNQHIIHTSFNQIINSGRLSSVPNVQNIPRDVIVDIRKGFIPRPGYVLMEADWDSAEYRLVSIASKEQKIIRAYIDKPRDADFHRLTASVIFNTPEDEVTIEERYIGKTLNFSILYGATKYSVARTLQIDLDQADGYIDLFSNMYPGITEWKEKLRKQIAKQRYTETLFGRRRYLSAGVHPLMLDKWVYRAEERALINHVIQGSCADLLKKSMVQMTHRFAKECNEAHLISTTHDSVMVELLPKDVETVRNILTETMEVTIEDILMPVSIEVKNSFSKKD